MALNPELEQQLLPRSGLQIRCQIATKQEKPPNPGRPGNRELVLVSLPWGVNPDKICAGVFIPPWHRLPLRQRFPWSCRAAHNRGVCQKQKNPQAGVVSAPGCEYCELSSWLSLSLYYYYYLKDREQIRENELQITANSTSSPNICSRNHVAALTTCEWFWRLT